VYFLYRGDPFGVPVDLAARLQGAATPSTGMIFTGTIEKAGPDAERLPLSSFLGQRHMENVKSSGDVPVTLMRRPERR
jgi:class 3 adenylate cyclase